jgi:signal transduction histidine kinase
MFPALDQSTKRRGFSGAWRALAILAPLVLLAILGVRGLETSRARAYDEAREQAASALKQFQPDLAVFVSDLQKRSVSTGERTHIELYPIPPAPSLPNVSQMLYKEALQISGTDPKAALAKIARLRQLDESALTPSGLPLFPFAFLLRLRLEPSFDNAMAAGEQAVRWHPSMVTPELLHEAGAILKQHNGDEKHLQLFNQWFSEWSDRENRTAILRSRRDATFASPYSKWIDALWWVIPDADGKGARMLSKKEIQSDIQVDAAVKLIPLLSKYDGVRFVLDGVPVLESDGATLASNSARSPSSVFEITLAHPEILLAQQAQQTIWFSLLFAVALIAEVGALIAMQRALARERQLGQLKSDFVSSVSHELRAPVASIRLMAENLETGAVTAEERKGEYHHLIAEECRRLSALIDNVLDFARIEQNRKSYQMMETDVAALVRDAVDFMQPRANARKQSIETKIEAIEPPPVCDGLAVRQAMINLLDNAVKFSPEGGPIHVRLFQSDPQEWRIAVKDNGPGIAREEHEAIFERFYRIGDELRRETQGAGIGLSIVQHIALGHGGRAEVVSEPGSGAEFTLILPIAPPGSNGAKPII